MIMTMRWWVALASVLAGCMYEDYYVRIKPPITSDEVIRAHKAGVKEEDLVARIRKTGALTPTVEEIERMREAGVSRPVIQAMMDYPKTVRRPWYHDWEWDPFPFRVKVYHYHAPGEEPSPSAFR